jgi:hypothetical protein
LSIDRSNERFAFLLKPFLSEHFLLGIEKFVTAIDGNSDSEFVKIEGSFAAQQSGKGYSRSAWEFLDVGKYSSICFREAKEKVFESSSDICFSHLFLEIDQLTLDPSEPRLLLL